MSILDPKKLHVTFKTGVSPRSLELPRCYTLTHSDFSGELFLTIGAAYDRRQIGGLYTRLMRDEVLAEWKESDGQPGLQVYCHVSGGIVLGAAGWRNEILHYHMPMVLEAFRHGDKELFALNPELENAPVMVHFVSNHRRFDQIEDWGQICKYRIETA